MSKKLRSRNTSRKRNTSRRKGSLKKNKMMKGGSLPTSLIMREYLPASSRQEFYPAANDVGDWVQAQWNHKIQKMEYILGWNNAKEPIPLGTWDTITGQSWFYNSKFFTTLLDYKFIAKDFTGSIVKSWAKMPGGPNQVYAKILLIIGVLAKSGEYVPLKSLGSALPETSLEDIDDASW